MKRQNDTRGNQMGRQGASLRDTQQTERFRALLALAREGNEDAIGDLWREFNFNFHREDSGHE